LANGRYTIAVQSSANGETLSQEVVSVHSRITEARLADGDTEIVLADGQSLRASEIISLRQPKTKP